MDALLEKKLFFRAAPASTGCSEAPGMTMPYRCVNIRFWHHPHGRSRLSWTGTEFGYWRRKRSCQEEKARSKKKQKTDHGPQQKHCTHQTTLCTQHVMGWPCLRKKGMFSSVWVDCTGSCSTFTAQEYLQGNMLNMSKGDLTSKCCFTSCRHLYTLYSCCFTSFLHHRL